MTALIWCKNEHLLCFQNECLPQVGETIIVEKPNQDRRTFIVQKVVWSFRFLSVTAPNPVEYHRVEIHVKEVAQ